MVVVVVIIIIIIISIGVSTSYHHIIPLHGPLSYSPRYSPRHLYHQHRITVGTTTAVSAIRHNRQDMFCS